MLTKSNLMGRPVYIVDGSRTPFLKMRGIPGPFHAADLAVAAGRALLNKLAVEPGQLDQVILGCVSSGPDEANIARVVALRLGCGDTVPAWTVQRNCASGMQALDSAAKDIASGRVNLVLAGGTESMSHHPLLLSAAMVTWLAAWRNAGGLLGRTRQLMKLSPAHLRPVVGLLRGLTDPVVGLSMGQTAEQLAWRFSIDRLAMDRFAMASHHRLGEAIKHQLFEEEIEPLFDQEGNLYELDDGYRPETDLPSLQRLRPVFDRPAGMVTAGNSAQLTDGAAVLLLASEQAIEDHDLPVLGRISDVEWGALSPAEMGLGPVHAMVPLLQRQELRTEQIDYWEINEAFAAQVLACLAAWQDEAYLAGHFQLKTPLSPIPLDRLNIDGGAISIGHPVGASGARIVLHLLKVLQRKQAHQGIASLCIGGGQGGAMLVERSEG